jgi:hypothetical protein
LCLHAISCTRHCAPLSWDRYSEYRWAQNASCSAFHEPLVPESQHGLRLGRGCKYLGLVCQKYLIYSSSTSQISCTLLRRTISNCSEWSDSFSEKNVPYSANIITKPLQCHRFDVGPPQGWPSSPAIFKDGCAIFLRDGAPPFERNY